MKWTIQFQFYTVSYTVFSEKSAKLEICIKPGTTKKKLANLVFSNIYTRVTVVSSHEFWAKKSEKITAAVNKTENLIKLVDKRKK